MDTYLQHGLPVETITEKEFSIFIRSDQYTLHGHWQISDSDRLNDIPMDAVPYDYLISLDNENYYIHPDEVSEFETIVSQLAACTYVDFIFRIVSGRGEVKHLNAQGVLGECSLSSIENLIRRVYRGRAGSKAM